MPGKWNPANNNGKRKITFDNASINYQGTAGQCVLQLYNHQSSIIEGLSVLPTSNDTYVNFTGCWYNEIRDFDIPRIAFNNVTSNIPVTPATYNSYTNVFRKGHIQNFKLYGTGSIGTTGGIINSLAFYDVRFDGKSTYQYNIEYYGTGFENISFDTCDISYATTSNLYIDVAQSSTMRVNFNSCYFDSNIPLVPNYDFKGVRIQDRNCQYASGQVRYVKARNMLSNRSSGNYGIEADAVISSLNLSRNGDLLYPAVSSSWVVTTGTPTLSILTNANTINNNSLQVQFSAINQAVTFSSVNIPIDGVYSTAVRLRVTAGSGTIQLTFNGNSHTFDLTPFAINEELILSTNSAGTIITQGTSLGTTLTCTVLNTSLTIEILEITMVAGSNAGINLPMYAKANMQRQIPTSLGAITNNGTINTSGTSAYSVIRVNPTSAITGVILQGGSFPSHTVYVINESAYSITFAASGSYVQGGSSVVIPANSKMIFVWDSGTSLWY